MTVSVFAARQSFSLCFVSLSLYSFSPDPFLSQLSQQTDVLLFEIELYSTVGVSRSKARLALMFFFLLRTAANSLPPSSHDVMPPPLLLLSHTLSTN